MGCSGFGVDPDIQKILNSLDEKVTEFEKTFIEKAEKVKKDFEEQQKNRHDKLAELQKKNEEITEKVIRDLNKTELEKEIEILSNEVDKMHYIFDLGLELSEPLRKVTLDKLMAKAKSGPAFVINKVKEQIEEIKKMPVIDFLRSTHGKILKNALAKKGMSSTLLKGFINNLFEERTKRRKAERIEFKITVNEFDDEKITDIKLDLYTLVEEEYKGFDKLYVDFCRDKIREGMFPSSK